MSTNNLTKMLVTISAAVCFGPAMLLLVMPGTLMAVYGLTLDAGGMFLGRVLGAVLVGLAIVFWRARSTREGELVRAAVWAGLLHNALLVIVILAGVLSGAIIWTGWPAAGLHVILAIGFVAIERRYRTTEKTSGS
jgi:hypothetical protein